MKRLVTLILITAFSFGAFAETDTVCLLHTNDIHDHLLPGYTDTGGIAYVSGYVASVRAERTDTLLVDAGDILHKGDMVAARSGGRVVYEALATIGYDAMAPGNHDLADGFMAHEERAKAAGIPVVCINAMKEDGTPYFTPSRIVDVDGVKVGLIGLTAKIASVLDRADTARAVAKEAERLDATAHLVVAVCHGGSKTCAEISRVAPAVDVFVAGHQHEAIEKPIVVPETGALIVGAGDNSRFVGRLELEIDLDSEKIEKHRGWLVPMKHADVPCDTSLQEWVKKQEQAICPEATRVIGQTGEAMPSPAVARLCAEGLRRAAKADIGLCAGKTMIAGLPKGRVDTNALFRTFRDPDDRIMVTELPGRELLAFAASPAAQDYRIAWMGKEVVTDESRPAAQRVVRSDIDPAASYVVAVPELIYDGVLKPAISPAYQAPSSRKMLQASALEATVAYMKTLKAQEKLVEDGAARPASAPAAATP